jgi:hypothetical protein
MAVPFSVTERLVLTEAHCEDIVVTAGGRLPPAAEGEGVGRGVPFGVVDVDGVAFFVGATSASSAAIRENRDLAEGAGTTVAQLLGSGFVGMVMKAI